MAPPCPLLAQKAICGVGNAKINHWAKWGEEGGGKKMTWNGVVGGFIYSDGSEGESGEISHHESFSWMQYIQ